MMEASHVFFKPLRLGVLSEAGVRFMARVDHPVAVAAKTPEDLKARCAMPRFTSTMSAQAKAR